MLELCSRDVTMVRMIYTRGGSKRKLTVTWEYLLYDSDEPLPSEGLRKLLSTAIGIKCSSQLDMMPMHTTLSGEAQPSIHEENV